ncbi:MAG TPA: rhodanese-like domain-containing protein [Candidatus Nitrosotalea sp.]|nr:rhodanese-like domain-containing protein [Candidatus Nitrosotalea sp.]
MFERLFGLESISPTDLHERLGRHGPLAVFDVNSPQSWESAHVPGARRLDPADFSERDLPAEKSAPIVFYCSNFLCRKAPNAARRAKSLGYTNVFVMSAGISGWQSAGLPTEPSGAQS